MDNEQKPYDEPTGEIEYVIEDETKPMSILQRIVNVFLSPGKLMENLSKYPKMMAPIVVFIIVGLGMAFVFPKITQLTLEAQSLMMIERYGVDYLNVGTEALGEVQGMVNMATSASAVVSAVIGPYISGFFAAVVLLILSVIFRVKHKFMQYYSMYVHIAMVTSVLTLISTVFMYITQSTVDVLSLGMLIPEGNTLNALYMAFSAISVSNIWTTLLVFLGLKAFTGCSAVKAAIISILTFALTVAYSTGYAFVMGVYYDFFYNLMNQI